MELKDLQKRAMEIRQKYAELEQKKYGKTWTNLDQVSGFVVDVGQLQKIAMAKEGVRDLENVDEKLAHELADCLYSVLVIASRYGVDIEESFVGAMDQLENKIMGSELHLL